MHKKDLLGAALDSVSGEVRQLLEVRVFAPHGLRHHLRQLHGGQRRRQPAVTAQHVDARLDQPDRLPTHAHSGYIHLDSSVEHLADDSYAPCWG